MNARDTLARIGRLDADDIHLLDAALELARWADAKLSNAPYHRHVQTLVQEARAYVGADGDSTELVLEAARQIIARRFGYAGETDPGLRGDAANLACVIDRRRGGAAALCILYAHVLDALGQRVELLGFSARPLVRVLGVHSHHVLDPFDDGRSLDARQLRRLHKTHCSAKGELDPFDLTVLTPRHVLIRLQDDIKIHHLRQSAPEAALAALEAELLIAPFEPRLWREAGLLHARLDHIGEAISALQHFLTLPGGEALRYTASQVLQQLQGREDKNQT